MSTEGHRHYYRSSSNWTCRCGQFQPGSTEYDVAQERAAIEAEAVAAERERIAEAVKELVSPDRLSFTRAYIQGWIDARAAVLALMENRR